MKLQKEVLTAALEALFYETEGNRIPDELALPGCEGLVIFEPPIFGFADAADPLFERYKDPKVIGKPYRAPAEWLPEAKTVLSFFLPFTEAVRRANLEETQTANAWLHGRIEGQAFLNDYSRAVRAWLEARGVSACVPAVDERFSQTMSFLNRGEKSRLGMHFSSTWSERHAAYAAGLGTFSLTRGLISEKGVAGRYGSVILSAELPPDPRPYTGVYDYCIRCGACIRRCPANAISLTRGKDQLRCGRFVLASKKTYAPRYGCGKCQVGVPCETRNPSKPKP